MFILINFFDSVYKKSKIKTNKLKTENKKI